MIKQVRKKQTIEDQYVNIETGETLRSEIPNLSHIVQTTEEIIIDYKKFVILSTPVCKFLEEILSDSDMAKIYRLSRNIRTSWNILCKEDKDVIPLTEKEVAEEVSLSRNKFHDFVNRLYKASILFKLKHCEDGVEKTVFLLNPHLAKRSRTLDKELLTYFSKLDDKQVQERIKKQFDKK